MAAPVSQENATEFSNDQYFFLSIANNFCGTMNIPKCTENTCNNPTHPVLLRKLSDSHSPDPVRVNQMFKQFVGFSDVWQCMPDSTMVARNDETCNVWS